MSDRTKIFTIIAFCIIFLIVFGSALGFIASNTIHEFR